jgi:hypothetical protein
MILQYQFLHKRAEIFQKLTSLRVSEFDGLWDQLQPKLTAARTERLGREKRQRAPGGGRHSALDQRDQLLLTLVWLRHYPIYPVLGYLFGVSRAAVERYFLAILPVLEQAGYDTLRYVKPTRKKRRNLAQLLDAIPELAVIVDSFEQRVQRPTTAADRQLWYSGKQRQQTVKTQVVVEAETGRLVDVAPAMPGSTSDLALVRQTQPWQRLPPGVALLGDQAYRTLERHYPLSFCPRRKPNHRPRSPDDQLYNRAFAQRRIVVENTICRMRRFACLTHTDRHHRRRLDQRRLAVALLVNHQLTSRLVA